MAVLLFDGSSEGNSSAWVFPHLDETIHDITIQKELEALQCGEIDVQEATERIAASLSSASDSVAAGDSPIPTLPCPPLLPRDGNEYDSRLRIGKNWLQQNARRMLNQIEHSGMFEDTFSQFLIMEATNDVSLLHLHPYKDLETNEDMEHTMSTAKRWNYFLGEPVGTTEAFPADVDTTAYSLLAFTPTSGVHKILDDMLANRNNDGLVQTYWDPTRSRVDICVLTNVVRAFYRYGRGSDVKGCLAHISNALYSGAYEAGTRHYCTPETFLFFLSHLVAAHPHAAELQCLRQPLVKALTARVGIYNNEVTQTELTLAHQLRGKGEHYPPYVPNVDGLALSMRILACRCLSVRPAGIDQDIERLALMQDEDGGWPLAWLCRFGRSKLRIGSRGVITAYAIQVLEHETEGRVQ